MTPLFKKLNFKNQQSIVVLNAPESFDPELKALKGIEVCRKVGKGEKHDFGIAFVITQKQLDDASVALTATSDGDAVLWIAYPKGTSKRYKCEFNRDGGWSTLGRAGFEPVSQVAIDEDWSALRFRRIEFIKSFTRSSERAVTQKGKLRAAK